MVIYAVRGYARSESCRKAAGGAICTHVERPIVVSGRRHRIVIDLFEETLRFGASCEQLTLKRLFFSDVFDEPAIAARLDAWKGELGRTEGRKRSKQGPDDEHFVKR